MEGSDGAIREARRLFAETPDAYFYADQYNNDANWRAHYQGTGPEIWRQTNGRVSHFLATIGTTGTLMGTGRFLKEQNSDIQVIAVEPDNQFHGIEGLKHIATSIAPGIYQPQVHDDKIPAATDDAMTAPAVPGARALIEPIALNRCVAAETPAATADSNPDTLISE